MNLPPVSPAVLPRLVLGSTSAYRRELLHRLGMPFEVRSPGVDETARAGEAPSALAERLALAGSLKGELPNTHAWNVPGVTAGEGADESAAIRELLKLAKDTLCIDATKVYASGYSGGGRMLSQYICNGFGDFAAAGFVMGLRAGTPVEENGVWQPRRESCQPSRPVSKPSM